MKKHYKIWIGIFLFLMLCLSGLLFYIKRTAPPGEEWISFQREELTALIGGQLTHLPLERLLEEKEALVLEKSIPELQQEVSQGLLTYEEITAIYLYRIRMLDQCEHGYNSVMEIAPDAIKQAAEKDRLRQNAAAGEEFPPLFGIPVMLKDNINTSGIPSSAGAVAFSSFIPKEDAGLVRALKEQGAVILGKNNLAEFAGYVSSVMPNGYSGKKGQTVNPFGPLKISPSGSSSGSAVAVAANLIPVSIGTETAGSIAGPAAANSVTGFKPTRDTVPGEGIFPLIQKVDTPGPLAKTVEDAALAYAAIAEQPFTLQLEKDALKGAVIGLISYDYNNKKDIQRMENALKQAGAQVRPVTLDESGISVQNIISLTFRSDFENFARSFDLPIQSLDDLLSFNREDPRRRIRYGQDLLEAAAAVKSPDPAQIEASIQTARKRLDALFAENGLDAAAFVNTTASTAFAAAGYPTLTVPLSKSNAKIPFGITFGGRYGEDGKLLSIGYSFEQTAGERLVLQQSVLP